MDLGYAATSSLGALREVLAGVGRGARVFGLTPLSEVEVARLLTALGASLNTHEAGAVAPSPVASLGPVIDAFAAAVSRPPVYSAGRALPEGTSSSGSHANENWRADIVIEMLRGDHPHLEWPRVLSAMGDLPETAFASSAAFRFIAQIVQIANGGVFPTSELLRRPWANARAQADALRHACVAPVDLVSFGYGVVDPTRVLQPVPGAPSSVAPNGAWVSVDLYVTLLRLSVCGVPDAERIASSMLDAAAASVQELVLIGMAASKVEDNCDSDPTGNDPNPTRSRLYNTLLTSAFGSLLSAPMRIAPTQLQGALLVRLWDTSRALTATSLLALARGIANRAGSDVEQLRVSVEGLSRVVGLISHLPHFVVTLLSAPAPQLAVEAAAFLSTAVGPEIEARLAAEALPAAWLAPAPGTGGSGTESGSSTPLASVGGSGSGSGVFRFESWLAANLSSSAAAPSNAANVSPAALIDRFTVACIAFVKRAVAAQTQVLQLARARHGAPMDGTGGGGGDASPNPAEANAQETATKEAIVKVEVLTAVFRALKATSGTPTLAPATQAAVNTSFETAVRVYPSLASAVTSQEIEETTNALFQRVYNGGITIPMFLDTMRRYKASSDAKERDTFSCMVRNLFDEYKYFPSYPEKMLRITGVIFGLLINNQLVASTTLGIALRYVLEALKGPPRTSSAGGGSGASTPTAASSSAVGVGASAGSGSSNNMFRFGLHALEAFKGRLPKWPQYCSHIVAIPHLRQHFPAFVAEVEAVLAAQAVPGTPPLPEHTNLGANTPLVSGDPLNPAETLEAELRASSGGVGSGGVGGGSAASAGAGGGTPMAATAGAAAGTAGGGAAAGAAVGGGGDAAKAVAAEAAANAPVVPEVWASKASSALSLKLQSLGADLTVALAAAAAGQPIPAILPSAAAAAALAKEAEDRAAAAAVGSSSGSGSDAGGGSTGGAHGEGVTVRVEAPAEKVANALNVILNNLTETNLDVKVTEAAVLLKPEFYVWFASYVVKRVATQPNYQGQYRAFLERLSLRDLDKEVLKAALDNAKKLLASDKIKTSTQERSLLKNLGSWLGRITLARNKPLLFKDLNLKELQWEAYETGRLIAVVAFVAKVLEGAAESRVFKPPNPWTLGLLSSLRELYDVTDLKLNLKFEVEVLAKTLGIELKDLRPSRSLHLRRRPDLRSNPDFNPKAAQNPEALPGIAPRDGASSSSSGSSGGSGGGLVGGVPAIPGMTQLVSLRSFSPIFHPAPDAGNSPEAIAAAAAAVATNGSAGEDAGAERDEPGGPKANLRNVVAVALDKAVRELMQPVVERSVTIAVITSRELVTKDFATEPDGDKMARAAHVLAADLAGSLAVITCADPLRVQTGAQLRLLLTAHPSVITSLPVSLQALSDAAVNAMLQGVVNENVVVGNALIEKAAMERAVRAIDEALAPQYLARRKAAEARRPFPEPAPVSASRWPAALPEVLRPRQGSGGLTPAQLRMYKAFSRGGTAATGADAGAPTPPAQEATVSSSVLQGRPPSGASAQPAGVVPAGQLASGVGSAANAPVVGQPATSAECNVSLDRLTVAIRSTAAQLSALNPSRPMAPSDVTAATLTNLPGDSDFITALRDLRSVASRVPPGEAREQACLLQVRRLFMGLLELNSPPQTVLDAVAKEAYLLTLQLLRELTQKLRRDMVGYLYVVPEDRRFISDNVVLGLLRSGLLAIPDFDTFLAKAPDAGRSAPGLAFAMRIAQRSIVMDRLLAPSELPLTLELLVRVASRHASTAMAMNQQGGGVSLPVPPQLPALLQAIKEVAQQDNKARAPPGISSGLPPGLNPPGLGSVFGGPPGSLPIAPPPAGAPLALVGNWSPSPQGINTARAAAEAVNSSDGYSEDVRQQVLYLLETWVRIVAEAAQGTATERHYTQYLSVLAQQGVLTSDATTERFFRVIMDLCVQSCAATAKPYPEAQAVSASVLATPNVNTLTAGVPTPRLRLSYMGVDALSKLVLLLLKVADGNNAKMALLQKLMGIFTRALVRDADINGGGCTQDLAAGGAPPPDSRFDARPYLRLFTNLLRDLHLPHPGVQPNGAPPDEAVVAETVAFNAQVLATFANVLHLVQPSRVPGFMFAWLELMSHRLLLPALLLVPGQRGWPLVHRLLIDLLRFLYPYLRRGEMNEGLRLAHKGMTRTLLVLLHDFPEFLADYVWTLLEVIPLSAVQMRNLVLAASPPALRLPDPFDRTLLVEACVEVTLSPRVLGIPGDSLSQAVRLEVDTFLRTRAPVSGPLPPTSSELGAAPPHSTAAAAVASSLRPLLMADAEEVGTLLNKWSHRAINALVPHLAAVTLVRLAEPSGDGTVRIPAAGTIAAASASGAAELFRALIAELDAEGRYALLATAASHLRYPNAQTLFFGRLLLGVFADAPGPYPETVKEQVTRVLVERLVAHRPHPWGLLTTFIELMRTREATAQRGGAAPGSGTLWSHPFLHSSPEVEKLFESIARSCLGGALPQGWQRHN